MSDNLVKKLYLSRTEFAVSYELQKLLVRFLQASAESSDSLKQNAREIDSFLSNSFPELKNLEQIDTNTKMILIGQEHSPTISLGKRFQSSDILSLKSQYTDLLNKKYKLELCDRGGQATLHMPGQLVIYPVLDLNSFSLNVKCYVNLLAQTCVAFLEKYNIKAYYNEMDPGVYVESKKIASIGIRVSKGISYHGISINITNDLNDFQGLSICGQINRQICRLEDLCPDLMSKKSLDSIFLEFADVLTQNVVKWSNNKCSP